MLAPAKHRLGCQERVNKWAQGRMATRYIGTALVHWHLAVPPLGELPCASCARRAQEIGARPLAYGIAAARRGVHVSTEHHLTSVRGMRPFWFLSTRTKICTR